MSLPLWMLLAFAGWTLLVLLGGVGVRRWWLICRGEAALTSFPADAAHGSAGYRRAMRAHANCLENLPVFGAVVLVAAAAGLRSRQMDALAVLTVAARMVQTSVHVLLPERNATVALRFTFFLLQVAAMLAMVFLIASSAHDKAVPPLA
jgi:uncharacterized MAPEG superfamily protein